MNHLSFQGCRFSSTKSQGRDLELRSCWKLITSVPWFSIHFLHRLMNKMLPLWLLWEVKRRKPSRELCELSHNVHMQDTIDHESITSRHRCLQNGSAISHKYSNWNYAFHLEVQILGHQSTTYFFMVHSQMIFWTLSLPLFSFNLDSGLEICTLWWFCPVKRQSNHGFSMQAWFQQLAFGHHQVYKQKSAGKFSRNRQVLNLVGIPANFLIGAIARLQYSTCKKMWFMI